MSMLVGFATGMFNRATKNIDRETALREKDSDKISALEGQLTTALLQKPADRPGIDSIKAITDVIKGAKADQKGLGRIDMFGRPGKRLDLDVMKTANLMNTVDKGYLNFKGLKMEVNSLYGSKSLLGKPMEQGNLFLTAVNDYYSVPEQRQKLLMHFKNNPAAVKDFKSKYLKHTKFYLNGYSTMFSSKNPEEARAFTELYEDFGSLKELENQIGYSGYTAIDAITNAASDGEFNLPARQQGTVYFKGEDKNGVKQALPFNFKKKEDYAALAAISSRLKYKRPSDFIFAFQDYVPELVLHDSVDPKTMYNYIFTAIELEKLNFTGKSRTTDQKKQAAEILVKRFGNNRHLMSLAVLPLIGDVGNAGDFQAKNRNKVFGIARAAEIEEIYNLGTGGITKVTGNYRDMLDVRKQLSKLLTLRKGMTTGAGFVESAKGVLQSTFGFGGQIEQAALSFSKSDGADGFDVERGNAAIKAYLENSTHHKGSLSDQEKLGEIDSMVISLAAKMARAVDPGGRLSNQDFEVQLRRLGSTGIFTNIPRQVAALSETLRDFEGQIARLAVINTMVTRGSQGGYSLSDMERRQLYADQAIQQTLQDAGVEAFDAVMKRQFSYDVAQKDNRIGVSPQMVGPRGEPVEILFDSNDNQVSGMYFVNGLPVQQNQIQFVPKQGTQGNIRDLYPVQQKGFDPKESRVGNDPSTFETSEDAKALIAQQQPIKNKIDATNQQINNENNVVSSSGGILDSDVSSTNSNGDGTFDLVLKDGTIVKGVRRTDDGKGWVQ